MATEKIKKRQPGFGQTSMPHFHALTVYFQALEKQGF